MCAVHLWQLTFFTVGVVGVPLVFAADIAGFFVVGDLEASATLSPPSESAA